MYTSCRHWTGPAPGRTVRRMSDTENRGGDEEQTRRDTAYSPASDRETEKRQANPDESPATADEDIDGDDVKLLPGTGGPDDSGDVEVDEDDLNMPRNPS